MYPFSRDQYFRKLENSNEWIEGLNGSVIYRFVEISQSSSETILKSTDRHNFYVRLTDKNAFFGETADNINNILNSITDELKGSYKYTK